jgi:hypothetical protein
MLGDGKHNPAAVAVGQVKKNITRQSRTTSAGTADAVSPILARLSVIVGTLQVGQSRKHNWYLGELRYTSSCRKRMTPKTSIVAYGSAGTLLGFLLKD